MDKITILKGPDRVRKRPAVVFSSDDIQGVEHAVRPILELFVTEAKLGCCKSLTVVHNKDEVTISGDDRGIYLGEGTDDHIWKNIFCEIYAGPRSISESAPYTFSLPDISHATLFGEAPSKKDTWFPEDIGFMDICAAQYASSFMNVDVVRAGVKHRLEFKKGYCIGGLKTEHTDEHSGTSFHFAMDPEVFSEVNMPEQFLIDALTNFAILSPGLTCTYINSATGFKQFFRFPSGVSDYLNQIVNRSEIPLFKTKMHAFGQDRYNRPKYQAHLEIAIAFSLNGSSHKYLHNFRNLRYGGLHVRNIQERVCRIINDCFHEEIRTIIRHLRNADITYEELQKYINIVVITLCPSRSSLWENGSQQAIINPMIADMAYDLISEEFDTFVYNNRHALLPIIKKILAERNTTHN